MKARIVKAPTGWGKTKFALTIAEEKPVIIAVPTLKLGREIESRAKRKGLETTLIEGRRNYPCGHKVAKKFNVEDKKTLINLCRKLYEEGVDRELRQGYLCCRRRECLYDMFSEKRKEAENSDVVIVTHSFLKLNVFARLLPADRVLVIDEVHSFLRNIKTPAFPYNVISVSEIKSVLKEVIPLLSKKSKRKAFTILKLLDGIDFSFTGTKLVWIKTDRGIIQKEPGLFAQVTAFAKNLHAVLNGFLSVLTKSEREMVSDVLTPIKQTAQILMIPDASLQVSSGAYATVKGGINPEIQIRQVLFSQGMWTVWNGILNNLNPEELYLMSATVPRVLMKMLNTKKIDCIENEEHYHRFNSVLDVVIGNESYSYETREEYLDYFVRFFKRFKRKDRGAVILASSYRDIEYVAEKLKSEFLVACQSESTSVDKLLNAYENEKVDVLLGNKTFWEGLNIQRESDFFVLKVPYSAPDDPDYEAGRLYYERNFFPVHKEDVKNLLIQGLGRIIRKDGEKKRVYVADRRILSFDCLFAEIPAYKRYLLL